MPHLDVARRSTLTAAAQRMQKRYAKLSSKRGLTPTARELAGKIKDRIDQAAKRVSQGRAHSAAHKLLESGVNRLKKLRLEKIVH